YIPFKYRPGIGKSYSVQLKSIIEFEKLQISEKKEFIFQKFYPIFQHAFENISFYRRLYTNAGIKLNQINSFEDISKLPIISKNDLREVLLEERSFPVKGRTLVNTGGSSGKPLAFYMDPNRFGNEWAHIHYMWSKLGYSPSKLKLNFDGRSTVKNKIQYDFVRHSLRYDIYADPKSVNAVLLKIARKHKIFYLHGYPSAIYNFAISCQGESPELLEILRETLRGAFLVSEFPNPKFRNKISEIFGIPTQSFYGHTETCVMAYEKQAAFNFYAFQTYGFAEAIELTPGKSTLIGTNYYNFASPLIRYDTEDGINVLEKQEGILEEFEIKEGRNGEYIIDRSGNKVPLTGLIFGRHHKIFEFAKHVQVYQDEPGLAVILFVPNKDFKDHDFKDLDLFDSSNIAITFSFKQIDNPVLTQSGKINLLVQNVI
ncbi:MAG TPA: hypothetical protein VL053_17375, partial [Arachidicoccus sp.]|nr:hypothetical protein [Arachidicoccus sp.]